MHLIYQNVSNFIKNLNAVFNQLKIDESFWNTPIILVHLKEVTILPSVSVYFAIRGKTIAK